MNVHFYLHGNGDKKDSVDLCVTHNGKRYRKSLGLTVDPRKWSRKKEQSGIIKVDATLTRIYNEITCRVDALSSQRDVAHAIGIALYGEDNYEAMIGSKVISFWDYFERWCGESENLHRFRLASYKVCRRLMGDLWDWDDIDEAWHVRLMKKMDGEGYTDNYKTSVTKHLRGVLLSAYKNGYYKYEDEWRKFKKKGEVADTIYLTEDDVAVLWGMDLQGYRARARDLFLLGVYSAARYQDYADFTTDNINGDNLDFVQKKTGERVTIPCSPKIKEILSRNGGHAPQISNQKLNKYIKEVCEAAGFTDMVVTRKHRGGRLVIEKKRRCDMVTTHTARRTGATLLYLSGVPIRLCRFLTGHSTDEMFMRYIKIRREEAADKLRDNPFFK